MRPVDIIINSRGNLAHVDAAHRAVDGLRGAIGNIAGISVGVGIERAFEGIKTSVLEAGREFVHFQAEMETAQYSIAAMQKQFAPGQFRDFNSALKGSAEVIEVIKTKANEMNVSIEDAVETYKTSAGAMYAGGVRDLSKQVDLALMLQQAMRGLGVQGFQATRDIQDILTGRSHMTKAGRELGLSDEEIKKAEEMGRLYEFLNEKLGAYAEAGKAAGGTLNAEMTRFHNTVQVLGAELSEPMFEELKKGVADLLAEIQKPEFREALQPMGEAAAEVAHAFFEGTKVAAEHADVIMGVAKAFAQLVAGIAVFKGLELGAGLVTLAAKWAVTTGAIKLNTAALVENLSISKQIAAARATNASAVAGGATGGAAVEGGAAAGATKSEIVTAGGRVAATVITWAAAGIVTAFVAYKAGSALDYKYGSVFRTIGRKLHGNETLGDSGKDDMDAKAERKKFDEDATKFNKDFQAVSNLQERNKLEDELRKRIAKRQAKIEEAGFAERAAINDSLSGYNNQLRAVQRLTEETLKHKSAIQAEQAEVSRLIGASTHFEEEKTSSLNEVQGAITGVDQGENLESLRKRQAEATQKTHIEDFSDLGHIRGLLNGTIARGDEIQETLDKSNTAKAQKKAGEKFEAGDILDDKAEEALQKEKGFWTEQLKTYRDQIPKGIAAQEALRQAQLKAAEAEDQRGLERAKAQHNGPEATRLEEKMLRDKNTEHYRSLGDDAPTAARKAQEDVEMTRVERDSAKFRLEKEIEIASLRKAGKNDAAREAERGLLVSDYKAKYGLDTGAAENLADKKLASEERKAPVRQEVDRFTRIGMFSGAGARNPLEPLAQKTNEWLQKIYEATPKTAVEDRSIVGNA